VGSFNLRLKTRLRFNSARGLVIKDQFKGLVCFNRSVVEINTQEDKDWSADWHFLLLSHWERQDLYKFGASLSDFNNPADIFYVSILQL